MFDEEKKRKAKEELRYRMKGWGILYVLSV
jgi:hypothetical protein